MAASLEDLSRLAERQASLEDSVVHLEQALKVAKQELDLVATVAIPEAMEELQLTTFSTNTGLTVEVENTIQAGLSKDRKMEAIAWLRAHAPGLIKREFAIIARDDEQGQELAELLAEYDVSDMPSVHPQTLKKFVRERLADGEDIPQDLFGVFFQRKAKVKR